MDAKTYCKKTAAFAGYIIQNIPSDLDGDAMDGWMNNPEATKKFLSGLKPPEMAPAKPTPLLSIIATTQLGAVAGKLTRKCFVGQRWRKGGRDKDFDNWLSANQSSAEKCAISTLAPSRDWMFEEGAATILGIGVGTDIVLLGKALIENDHTMTLVQAEEMVEKTESGEKKTGMRTDGWGNWFFVETGDPETPVSVGDVRRGGRDWYARVYRLDNGNRWNADNRLFVRNSRLSSAFIGGSFLLQI